jgi:two-component system response regulator RegA
VNKRVMIADPQHAFACQLGIGFRGLGYEPVVVDNMEEALIRAKELRPQLVISEQRLGTGTWLDLLKSLRYVEITGRFAIVTASGSISSAVLATKLGVAAYLAKPVTAKDVIRTVEATTEELTDIEQQPAYCSLERAKWEYINMTVTSAGSIAEAARRLRVERRSLRRMLAKYPPAQ